MIDVMVWEKSSRDECDDDVWQTETHSSVHKGE